MEIDPILTVSLVISDPLKRSEITGDTVVIRHQGGVEILPLLVCSITSELIFIVLIKGTENHRQKSH